jgi:S-DNA-T family DNA segregation ATPase FtsK/SpoIIIE
MHRKSPPDRHVVRRGLPDNATGRESRVDALVRARLAGDEVDIEGEIRRLRDEIGGRLAPPRVSSMPPSPPRASTPTVEKRDEPPTAPRIQVPSVPSATEESAGAAAPRGHKPAEASPQEPEDLDGPALLRRVLGALRVRVLDVAVGHAQDARRGARYLVRVAPNVRLAQLQARASDIGRAMRGLGAPIIENVPADDRISIEFFRSNAAPLPLWPVLDQLGAPELGTLPALLGVDTAGVLMLQDLATAPQGLIAGASGSGKTTLLQQIIASLIATLTENEVELLLVDPKGTDLTLFHGVPHLRGGQVLVDARDAVVAVEDLVGRELEERTAMLRQRGHSSVVELNRSAGTTVIKPIVVVVEEFADVVDSLEPRIERKAFLQSVVRIGQRARSCGIHLIIVTQRPSTDILPSRLKANLSLRICLQVPQLSDSMVVIDRPGAERLAGRGDFLLRRDGEILRGRGLYASRAELVDFAGGLRRSTT